MEGRLINKSFTKTEVKLINPESSQCNVTVTADAKQIADILTTRSELVVVAQIKENRMRRMRATR